ncbi:hypothetical protein M514_13551 [Trichuris suis]|uniref:HTH CENPB-type domain-containing protein n=1 Tax=Trichuris suis TaxID=68888 RepID=A0A085MRU8_9BILA|nr:hypothetical protein M513_13551 [Trichuris suis]KFD59944.1 hypothetical protein M514_13551 [Trichuris suis]KHJ40091.1 hypothetical protein D918_09884 [Trichuris suis]
MSASKNEEVMEAVYTWFLQSGAARVPVSGTVLRHKALYFNERLNGDPDFKASQEWMDKFVKRYGIRGLQAYGEKLSADTLSAVNFTGDLKELLEREH